jgi:hypothetical protein
MTTHLTDLVLDPLTSDPSPLGDGQRWTNSTDNRAKVRLNGATQVLSHKAELDTHKATNNEDHGITLEQARAAGNTLSGDVNAGGNKITNATTDGTASTLATNQQVDDKIRARLQGFDYQDSVLDKDVLDPTPLTPGDGDSYLILGTGAGAWATHDNDVARWRTAIGDWDYSTPTLGTRVFVEDEGRKYEFVGSSWQFFEETHDHGQLLGLADLGDHPGYLDLGGTRPMTGDLDMGTNDVTNVGLVDGVDVDDHSALHDPGGADALTTAAPGQGVGGGNSEGSAASFARSDHDHTIRTTTGPQDLTVGAIADGDFLKRVGTAIVGDATPGFLEQKSGRVLKATFTGNPKTATVTFGTAMSTGNYHVDLTPEGTGGFSPYVENKTTAGFDINANANNINNLVLMGWLATVDGET